MFGSTFFVIYILLLEKNLKSTKDSFTFNVLRIRPKHWHTFDGDDVGSVGMRVEFYGCVADDILRNCFIIRMTHKL